MKYCIWLTQLCIIVDRVIIVVSGVTQLWAILRDVSIIKLVCGKLDSQKYIILANILIEYSFLHSF